MAREKRRFSDVRYHDTEYLDTPARCTITSGNLVPHKSFTISLYAVFRVFRACTCTPCYRAYTAVVCGFRGTTINPPAGVDLSSGRSIRAIHSRTGRRILRNHRRYFSRYKYTYARKKIFRNSRFAVLVSRRRSATNRRGGGRYGRGR